MLTPVSAMPTAPADAVAIFAFVDICENASPRPRTTSRAVFSASSPFATATVPAIAAAIVVNAPASGSSAA